MNLKRASLLIIVLIVLDQALKIWVKTNMHLEETITVIPDWFRLRFVENNGAAFGMQIPATGAFDWGKLLLSLLRIGLVAALIWYLRRIRRQKAPAGVIAGISLIIAGAIGNIIDCALYGVLFSVSTPAAIAHFGDGYAPFMMGRVVDMLYFPLFRWGSCPSWLDFLVDSHGYFFGPIFNLADSYISVAVVYLLFLQYKFFK